MEQPFDKAKMQSDALFTDAFMTFNSTWGNVWTFREAARGGIPKQEPQFRNKMAKMVERMKPGGDLANWLQDGKSFFDSGMSSEYVEQLVSLSLMSAQAAVDAASIVFGHSVLDSVMNTCIQVVCVLDPEEFARRVEQTTVTVKMVRESGVENVIHQKIKAELKDLERRSLGVRSDFLHDVCKPGKERYDGMGYIFDRDRLVAVDNLRHKIVHGPTIDVQKQVDDDLRYLWLSCMYFVYMIAMKYSLKLMDPKRAKEMLTSLDQESP